MISLTVTVIGTGTMGQGIAQVAAQSGHTTRLFDASEGRASAAIGAISAQLERLVTKGRLTGGPFCPTNRVPAGGACAVGSKGRAMATARAAPGISTRSCVLWV